MTVDHNVAARLSRTARLVPSALAIVEAVRPWWPLGRRSYLALTFGDLDEQTTRIAAGLIRWGIQPGMRMVLAVPFGIDFIRLTFALLKAGVVPILVDPGMGRRNLVRCLEAARPDGFVAVPKAQGVRTLLRRRFPAAVWNVTVGHRWFWGGVTLEQIVRRGAAPDTGTPVKFPHRAADDDAAIIFTTGSTGPPKGVRYTHDVFNHQIDLIRDRYQIRPGGRDLACFPLFGLFDAVMGVTAIIPEMDPTKPAEVNPQRIFDAVQQWEIDQAFGSPALWNTVTRWCDRTGNRLPTLRRILSAGAPVPPGVLELLRACVHPEADVYTPYGATEALPIASIESREILNETAAASRRGRGTCVGTRFDAVEWKVIAVDDGPIPTIDQVRELPKGEIGELMVTGPVVTRQYVTRTEQNALHKVRDGDRIWHRMGDVGYLDEADRFWFCGRKAHRVQTTEGTLFTVPCEAIFNTHPAVYRSALVGAGAAPHQRPIMIIEPLADQRPATPQATERLVADLRGLAEKYPHTRSITDVRIHPSKLPVDIRHNSKIFREQLAQWLESKEGR